MQQEFFEHFLGLGCSDLIEDDFITLIDKADCFMILSAIIIGDKTLDSHGSSIEENV